jgi:2'-5' RNA ligase
MSSWFVAFPVVAGDWFARLSPVPAGTRFVAAADLHLTLAFLGAVGESRARTAFNGLSATAIRCVEIRLGAVVPMGSPGRANALCAKVEPADTESRTIAEALTASRDSIFEAAALPRETRTMRPHVTLARIRRKADVEQRRRAIAWAEKNDLTSIRIRLDRIGLYAAARDRSTHAYDVVESRDLFP